MPRGDGTGPSGMGSKTGRAAGYCAGYDRPGFANSLPGRGYGRGLGRGIGGRGGFGWRNRFFTTGLPGRQRVVGNVTPAQPMDSPQEKIILQERVEALQAELEAIKNRLAQIEPELTAE